MFAVLLVDDDKSFNDALALCIKKNISNATVLKAVNGKVGTEILKNAQVDLIITDPQMPVMDGYDLIKYRNEHLPEVPLIVITADAAPDLLKMLKAQGVNEYREKPCDCKAVASLAVKMLKARKTLSNKMPIPKNLPVN